MTGVQTCALPIWALKVAVVFGTRPEAIKCAPVVSELRRRSNVALSVVTTAQHRRLLGVVRKHGPWPLILAHHFTSPEEVLATTSGDVPAGVTLTWDLFLTPVFRGYLGRGSVCLYRDIEDCFYNSGFLDLVRSYWGAKYAEPDSMLFNLQGPCAAGGAPHIDGTDRKSTRLNSSHMSESRMPSSA